MNAMFPETLETLEKEGGKTSCYVCGEEAFTTCHANDSSCKRQVCKLHSITLQIGTQCINCAQADDQEKVKNQIGAIKNKRIQLFAGIFGIAVLIAVIIVVATRGSSRPFQFG